MQSINSIFGGRKLVIASMHAKERVIGPLLETVLGVKIEVPKNFNTDQFGTFTGEIKRQGDQLEAARAKAYAAMESTGLDLAVASEGSFNPHPSFPFLQSGLELILLVDRKNKLEIRGHHRTMQTNMSAEWVKSPEEALAFAKRIGFPKHGVIARKSPNRSTGIYKDIQTETDLIKIVAQLLSRPFVRSIFLESDMRAHKNPTRMEAIEKATQDLIKQLQHQCPICRKPGFSVVKTEPGLPCKQCGTPTELPLYQYRLCTSCSHESKESKREKDTGADPQHCDYCNP